MRYFYDTEFIEDGHTIDLVSIGVVCEDGREYYAVSTEFDERKAGQWVRQNVLNQLPSPSSPLWKSRATIREELTEFLCPRGDDRPELWAWIGAYDHVAFAQLWGDMTKLPRQMPRFTRELRQYWEMAGKPRLSKQADGKHDALADARHNLVRFNEIAKALPLR
ncbi:MULTISPECIES: polyadenylate-specific 3'-exoribonuclease AS [unclassified Corynebacterium]|uniref:polyadenylate-specific 3'-exoribonuclease AS n=1 Tax=unclassified Corynebacterium TaxID=2624378 RepID=UPI003098FC66